MTAKVEPDVEVLNEGGLVEAVRENAVLDENVISEVFVVGDDDSPELVDADEILAKLVQRSMGCFDSERIHRETKDLMGKSIEGSLQSRAEIGEFDDPTSSALGLSRVKVVEPPYPPELMATFLEVDETHFRSVETKTIDSVGRPFKLGAVQKRDGAMLDAEKLSPADQAQVEREIKEIRAFVQEANDVDGFAGVLELAAMDHEGIGWGAIEVIRSRDMLVRKIVHVPAVRLRVLQGWRGFVEILGPEKFRYYQPFGEKIVSPSRPDPITHRAETYRPRLDGPLNAGKLEWRMIDRDTGMPTEEFDKSANELIWIRKKHVNTVYYGFTNVIPALGHVLGNVHIRDFSLQFFEHNTVPRFAIIIEGAKLAKEVKEEIMKFFSTHIRGKAHKTLIIPIPSMRGEVKIRFEKLAADAQEGSFLETRKSNAQGIMTAHGVSPAIIGIADVASIGSGKGLSQADNYKDRIVTPSQVRWERVVNWLFRLGLGIQMTELRFDPLDIRDREAEAKILTSYQERGIMTVNEVRKKAGLGDPIRGGDRAFIETKMGIVFVDELTEGVSANIDELQSQIETMERDMRRQSRVSEMTSGERPVPSNGKREGEG